MASTTPLGRFPLSCRPSRRAVLQSALVAAAAGIIPNARAAEPAPAARGGLLVQPRGLELLRTRSKIVLELEGQLRIDEPDPDKAEQVRNAEVTGKSTLDYFETIAFVNDAPVVAARSYTTADCENRVSGNATTQQLRPDCRQTRLMLHAGTWEQYCPDQPLDAREVELLRSPVNSLALESFLPMEAAKPDTKWTISKEAAKNIFNLDAVHNSTLTARVVKVEQETATIELEGTLEATANSVATKLEIKGNCHATRGRECALVTWLGLVIKEERAISQSEPGFSVTARVRMIRAETEDNLGVTRADLLALATEDAQVDGRWLVRLQSVPGRYSLLTDRRWKTYIDGGEEAILRMIENNIVLAQCNISKLTDLDQGTQLTLEALQADIKKSLGDSFGAFQESSEKMTASKLRLLRSVISGELEEVPIQWIFNHLSDDSGRRVALEFTMGGNHIERFGAADEQMTASFEFLPQADASPATPTPAPPTPASAPQASVPSGAKRR